MVKRSAVIFLSFLTLASAAYADTVPPAILKAIKPLNTKSVELSSGVLRVVMGNPMVSIDMYRSVSITGVCFSLIGDRKSWGNSRIDRIEVLNDIGKQGYALEEARKTCGALGALTADQEKKYVADHTIECIAGDCRRR